MPVMDGLEAAAIISKVGVTTPIIALTANIMSNDLELYKTSGMPDYLGKPFTSQELWRCLVKYLPVIRVSDVDENQQYAADAESMKQLQAYFLKSNKNTFSKIKQAIETGDSKQAHRLVHTLKSNAGQIAEKQLQDAAAAVEDSLIENDATVTEAQMQQLEAELNAVLDKLEQLPDKTGTQGDEIDFDKGSALSILDELEPMLEKSKPECMYMLGKIRSIPGAEKLADYVEDFNFSQAIDELKKVKDSL